MSRLKQWLQSPGIPLTCKKYDWRRSGKGSPPSSGVASNHQLAAMKDRASVNGAAMRIIKVQCIDIPCAAHTLNTIGEYFNITTTRNFVTS